MSSEYTWSGATLRGPLKPATEEGGVELPRGPPESAPFDAQGWKLGLSKPKGATQLTLTWPTLPAHPVDLKVHVRVDNSGNLAQEVEFNNPDVWDGKTETWPLNNWDYYDRHLLQSSDKHSFKLTVSCPSLLDRVHKPDIATVATSISSKIIRSG